MNVNENEKRTMVHAYTIETCVCNNVRIVGYLYLRNECGSPVSKCCIELDKSCSRSYFRVCILPTELMHKEHKLLYILFAVLDDKRNTKIR